VHAFKLSRARSVLRASSFNGNWGAWREVVRACVEA
jgi:hypothetical protein